MSWTCPHQLNDNFCGKRKQECKPGSDGCIMENKFTFIELDENSSESDKDKRKTK